MNATRAFRADELVSRKVKINGEWQTRTFPVVGGRLRILHENNDNLSIQTEIIRIDNDFSVVKATVESQKGKFNGTGTASIQRDAKLADSLVELAETRAIARALRFSGIGVEFTSAEEMSHVARTESEPVQTTGKEGKPVFSGDSQNNKSETKSGGNGDSKADAPNGAAVTGGPKPHGGNGRPTVTSAQLRALHALTKRANYSDEDIQALLRPFNAATFEDLARESASHLISYLQTEAAA